MKVNKEFLIKPFLFPKKKTLGKRKSIENWKGVFDQDLEKEFLVELFPKKVRWRKMFCFRCGGREFEVENDCSRCKNCGLAQYYAYASVGC